jgi:hypothetical protein
MLIAEEFLLLSLDDETGKPMLGSDRLGPALGGALVAELALMERIGVTPHDAGWNKRGRITITNLTPTDDTELDEALRKLAESEGKKLKDVLSDFASKKVRLSYKLRERLLERLAKAGVLKRQEGTVLGFIPQTTWPVGDVAAEYDVRQRLQSTLVSGFTPTERTLVLIALLQVTGLLPKVVTTDDKRALKARAKQLTEGDWAAKAVKDAIDEVTAATVAVVAGASAGSGGGS